MARFVRKQKQYIGMSPDELVFRGQQKANGVLLSIIDFDADKLQENIVEAVAGLNKFQETDTVTWLNIDGLHNTEILSELSDALTLDKLVLADVLDIQARPRVKEHFNCVHITIKMLQESKDARRFSVENLSLVLTKNMLISFQERKGDVFDPIRERIRAQKKRIRTGGIDFLAFALLDIVVDNYLFVLSTLGEKIEALEDALLIDPDQSAIDQINAYKREMNFLRKNIKPAREMIFNLSKLDTEFISDETQIHLKELQDNISQASDVSDSYREILSDQLNIYHTTISTKLNDIMKFLTVFSVIFIPLTFIAGIYGTNFEYLPELQFKYSYFVMWAIMVIVAIGMLLYFKRRKWL